MTATMTSATSPQTMAAAGNPRHFQAGRGVGVGAVTEGGSIACRRAAANSSGVV